MSNLALVKSEMFGSTQCDFYQQGEKFFMTAEQLGTALEYSVPRESINKLVSRHEYLRQLEFSAEVKMTSPSGEQSTRIFTEDGIYEITMLSKTEKAREFRAFVRKILKDLRTGKIKAVKPIDPEIIRARSKNAEARLQNSTRKNAEFLLMAADKYGKTLSSQAVELLTINALEMVAGPNTLPRPQIDKTYTATEIAAELCISANRLGRFATNNGLKTDKHGITVLDKSPHSDKQVASFLYNEVGKAAVVAAWKKAGERDEE